MEDSRWTYTLKKDFEDCLKHVKSIGSFAYSEVLQNVPNPGLCIKDIGSIGLPLSERDAKAIALLSWEFSPAKFTLTNPAWENFIKLVEATVGQQLGLDPTDFKVELWQLLLHDQSGVSKPQQQDSKRNPEIFGTLVIALPSKHEGGEISITHDGREIILQTSKCSAFDYSLLTWYSDVILETQSITSGHRLALTYKLIHTATGSPRTAANLAGDNAELRSIMSRWDLADSNICPPETLAYVFQNRYAQKSLSYNALKGQDKRVALHLKKACEERGFYFCLANIKRTIRGSCKPTTPKPTTPKYDSDASGEDFHSIIDEEERDTELVQIIELDGTKTLKDLDYNEDWILQKNTFEYEPDKEYYDDLSTTTHVWKRTVGIIMPLRSRIPFLLRDRRWELIDGVPEINVWLDRLFKTITMDPDSESSQKAKKEVQDICEMVIGVNEEWEADYDTTWAPFPAAVVTRIVSAALELDNWALCTGALMTLEEKVQVPLYHDLGVMLRKHNDLDQEITEQLHSLECFSDRYEALLNLSKGFLDDGEQRSPGIMPEFFLEELRYALDFAATTSAAAGVALFRAAMTQKGQPDFDIILAMVKENIQSTPMALAFLMETIKAAPRGEISESDSHDIFRCLIGELLQDFNLGNIPYPSDVPIKEEPEWLAGIRPQESKASEIAIARQNGENVADLLRFCFKSRHQTECAQLVTRVSNLAQILPVNAFNALLFPLLEHLIKISPRNELSPFRDLFRVILSEYVVRYIKTQPSAFSDWARDARGCGCQPCRQLDRFLLDPNSQIGCFPMVEGQRTHLEYQIRVRGFETYIRTEYNGRPYTLVLTKSRKANPELEAWKERSMKGTKYIRELGPQPLMRSLLGNIFGPIWSPDAKALASLGVNSKYHCRQ